MTAALAFITSPIGKGIGIAALILALLGVVYWKGHSDGEANIEAAVAAANKKADDRAAALSSELVINQAIAMGATAKKADSNVQQVKAATTDADRMRAGSRGVRDLLYGSPNAAK